MQVSPVQVWVLASAFETFIPRHLSMRAWFSGRTSPCQGEGHGFESRRPLFQYGRLYSLPYLLIWRRGQVVRQGSAKPSSRVRIPSSPQNVKKPLLSLQGLYCFHVKTCADDEPGPFGNGVVRFWGELRFPDYLVASTMSHRNNTYKR